MNDCTEYIELISAYADGELTELEALRVEEHLSECSHCAARLEFYGEISRYAERSCADAPDLLLRSVMARISQPAEILEKTPPPNKNHKILRTVLTRYAPLAACLAVILLLAPRLFELKQSGSAPPLMNESAMSGGGSANTAAEESAFDSGAVNSDVSGTADYLEHLSPTPAPQQPPSLTSGEGSFSEASIPEGGSETEDTAWSAELPQKSADYEYVLRESIDLDDYYALITITGEFPGILDKNNYPVSPGEDGASLIFIPREKAEELIESGYEAEYYNENAETAVVLWRQ